MEYLFTLHSGVSSGITNIELIIATIQSLRSLLHFTWLSEKVFNRNVHKIFGHYTIGVCSIHTVY